MARTSLCLGTLWSCERRARFLKNPGLWRCRSRAFCCNRGAARRSSKRRTRFPCAANSRPQSPTQRWEPFCAKLHTAATGRGGRCRIFWSVWDRGSVSVLTTLDATRSQCRATFVISCNCTHCRHACPPHGCARRPLRSQKTSAECGGHWRFPQGQERRSIGCRQKLAGRQSSSG